MYIYKNLKKGTSLWNLFRWLENCFRKFRHNISL